MPNLPFPPTPESAAQHADMIVQAAKKLSGVDLDFSPESLAAVDRIIEQFRQEGMTQEQVAVTLVGFGCYVGEVFVRRQGAKWRVATGTGLEAGAASNLVVDLGSGALCNPIGKVFKRLTGGEADSLLDFYHVWTQLHQMPAPAANRPAKRSFWRRLFGA